MIDEIKAEIEFLKSHGLESELWKESSIELIKRLTSDIHAKNETQRKKLIEEVRDFVIKGADQGESFDFIFQETKKFFREIHISHQKQDGGNKVIARIDRTIIGEDNKHIPFENFITLKYTEDESDKDKDKKGKGGKSSGGGFIVEKVSILGTKYAPFPANLVFAEHLFSHIAGDIVGGITNKKEHYRNLEERAIASIPDIYATPEQRSRDRNTAEDARYKIWDKKQKSIKAKIRSHDDIDNDAAFDDLVKAFRHVSTEEIETIGLSKEMVFQNIVSHLQELNSEEEHEALLKLEELEAALDEDDDLLGSEEKTAPPTESTSIEEEIVEPTENEDNADAEEITNEEIEEEPEIEEVKEGPEIEEIEPSTETPETEEDEVPEDIEPETPNEEEVKEEEPEIQEEQPKEDETEESEPEPEELETEEETPEEPEEETPASEEDIEPEEENNEEEEQEKKAKEEKEKKDKEEKEKEEKSKKRELRIKKKYKNLYTLDI